MLLNYRLTCKTVVGRLALVVKWPSFKRYNFFAMRAPMKETQICVGLLLQTSVNRPPGAGIGADSFLHWDRTILEPSRYLNVHWAKMWILSWKSYPKFLYKNLWITKVIHFCALHLSIFIMIEILFFPLLESWDHDPLCQNLLFACFCGLKITFFHSLPSLHMINVEKLKNKDI